MNKTLVSISVAVIACTIGVTTQLAGLSEAPDMAAPDIRPPTTEEPKLTNKNDYIELARYLSGYRTPRDNASMAVCFVLRQL